MLLLAIAAVLYNVPAKAQDRNRLRAWLDSCTTAKNSGEYEMALRHLEEAYLEARSLQDSTATAEILVKRSNIRQLMGDFFGALTDLYDALRSYDPLNDQDGLATVYNSIGAIHHYDKNFEQAGTFYAKSMAIRQRQGNEEELAILYGNLGSLLEDMGRPDSAMVYHRQNLTIRRASKDQLWIGICYANLGTCHDKLGHLDSATHYLESSLSMMRTNADASLISQVLAMLGHVHLHTGELRNAERCCLEGLRMASTLNTLPTQEQCLDCLYQVYKSSGLPDRALVMLERLVAARDSMFGRTRAKGLLRIELNYAFEREQLADSLRRLDAQHRTDIAYQQRLGRERDEKRLFLFGSIGVLLLAGGLWSRLRYMHRSRNLIQRERERSDELLLNILPGRIAEELKANGRAHAREVDGVSILFTDFHQFSKLSEQVSAPELVAEIDACFRAFDAIAVRYGLEKIKTIGDAYMCAGGLPDPRHGSAVDTVMAALEMQHWLKERAVQRAAQKLLFFRMRAGIHSGPVVAGIVGESKFQYDIWGDTVNTAARMESASAVDEVNISKATFLLVQNAPGLCFKARGRVQTKGKGELAMFYVRLAEG